MSSVSGFPPPHLIPEEEGRGGPGAEGEGGEGGPERRGDTNAGEGVLALPAPGDGFHTLHVDQDGSTVRFDDFGPMVNTDGTLSRIHNWTTLSEQERQTAYRILVKRNQSRLEAIKLRAEQASEGDGATQRQE